MAAKTPLVRCIGGLTMVLAGIGGAIACLAACGSRTGLPACTTPGAVRACDNACGMGSQTCVNESWTACDVAVVTRACSNACGQGAQICADGAWSACAVPEAVRTCTSACGQGHEDCIDGGWQPCDAPLPGPPTFAATVRDFNDTQPDFDRPDASIGLDPGIVAETLGSDDKPVYAGDASTPSTHGAAYFYEWYHDTPDTVSAPDASASPDINMTTGLSLALLPDVGPPGTYAYVENSFFPIDNRLLGNEGRPHNYDFTLELEASFQYSGGETFSFESDDDSWVFLNRTLAVDLGGVHRALPGSVNLDVESGRLGIVKGGTYAMHLFYAERHVTGAVLHIEVTAADFGVCDGGS